MKAMHGNCDKTMAPLVSARVHLDRARDLDYCAASFLQAPYYDIELSAAIRAFAGTQRHLAAKISQYNALRCPERKVALALAEFVDKLACQKLGHLGVGDLRSHLGDLRSPMTP